MAGDEAGGQEMKPERWQEIERLYDAALELASGERAAFLEKACVGDEALRREVDALLASRSGIDRFMEKPAMEVAAKALAQDQEQVPLAGMIGRSVAHYRIVRQIGSGGMGVIYEAEDVKLKRTVALKFLPEAVSKDRRALERFQREAIAASALNHPNICTIHEIGEADGQPFLVMELLEGETLKQSIAGKTIPLDRILDIAVEFDKSRKAYEDFFNLWKDADPNLPILMRAKTEYEMLTAKRPD
jgi:hypothetical protein